jgi:hypothetical protein
MILTHIKPSNAICVEVSPRVQRLVQQQQYNGWKLRYKTGKVNLQPSVVMFIW